MTLLFTGEKYFSDFPMFSAKLYSLNIIDYNMLFSVEVPGNEGKAGMAAIVGSLTDENLKILISHLKSNLQQQSVPVFIRKVDKIPKTANFKTRKVELVQEGFKCENVWLVKKVS